MKAGDISPDAADSVFVNALTGEKLTDLMALGTRRRFEKGAAILLRGSPGDSVFFLEQGRVEVSLTSKSGRKSVLNHVGPGACLGEISVLDGLPRTADVYAATEVEGVMVSRTALLRHLRADPDVMLALVAELCSKMRATIRVFEAQSLIHSASRLARTLLWISGKWGEPAPNGAIRIVEQFSQSDLGELAGLARENVNRLVRSWSASGILAVDGRDIEILDFGALREFAEL